MHNLQDMALTRKNIRSFLTALDHFRTQHDLSIDEAIIFIAIGDLNFSSKNSDYLMMRPTNMTGIAYQLDVPRETVRRKVKTLLSKGLIRTRGREIYLENVKAWSDIGAQFGGLTHHLRVAA